MKKFISFIAACFIAVCPLTGNASYLYTQKTTQKINNAITYEQRNIITENGWIRAYIAYVDITDPNASVKVLTSSAGSSYLSTVKQMAKDSGAALAINGDFFNVASGQTNMLGMVYQNGELISSPALDNMVTFALTEDNEVIMDYFSHSSTVTSPQGYTCPIYQINKMPVDTGAITMLTDKWASKTPGEGFRVMLVENDVVTGFKELEEAPVDMPQNGYALVTNPWINAFFDNFAVGDVVTVETIISPDAQAITEATGGNTMIVNEGKVCSFTSNVSGYAQRSGIGITADGKTLILVATDGRQTGCRGLTQTELANLMITLGAHRAINLDGGGSTTFTMKSQDGSYDIKNQLSSERKVSTSIGVFSAGMVGDSAARGELVPSQSVVLAGDSIRFDAIFYDKYENLFAHNAKSTLLYDENGKNVNIESYTPPLGKHTIYAKCNDVVVSTEVEAVDSLFAIEASVETIDLTKGSSQYVAVYGYDNQGRKMTISPRLIEWYSSSDDVKISAGKVTAITEKGGIVTVKYKDVMDFVNVNKSESKLKAPPSVYGKDEHYGTLSSGKKVAISGNVPSGATLLNRLCSINRLRTIGEYDKAFVTAKYIGEELPANCKVANSYSAANLEKTSFVTLANYKGYIESATDWSKLVNVLADGNSNIVITAELPLEHMSEYDRNLLHELMANSVKAGKKVFFVSSGETSCVKMQDGVRYITCGIVADYKTTNMSTNAKTCPYVVFSVDGSDIRFEFVED